MHSINARGLIAAMAMVGFSSGFAPQTWAQDAAEAEAAAPELDATGA